MDGPASRPAEAVLQPRAHGLHRSRLMVADAAVAIKRFHFLQRELIRMEAGWVPAIEDWGSKLALPELIWQDGLVARSLRERLLELRYPERNVTVGDDAALVGFFRSLGHAPHAHAFVQALATVLKPHLRQCYAQYLTAADDLDDRPSTYFLEHAIVDLDRQIAHLSELAASALQRAPELRTSTEQWCRQLRATLRDLPPAAWIQAQPPTPPAFDPAAAGGKPFQISRTGVRDRRFERVAFAWPDRCRPQPPGDGLLLQLRQAVHHLNEVWAAEMAAACLYDFMDEAPPEFLNDAVRWCFDEIRHCRMGYERLKEWGFTEAEMPLDSFSYDAGQDQDAIVRLGIIFFFETTYIHTKSERTKIFAEEGDRMSSHDMDFDWADELIHTYYGKTWLTHFLEKQASARKPADIKREAERSVQQRQAGATAEDVSRAEAIRARMLHQARTPRREAAAYAPIGLVP